MDNIIQTIIDALSQGYGRRDTPGWAYVLAAIISAAGAISAKELAKKRKALRVAKTAKLTTQELRASLFSQDDDGEVHYQGWLKKEQNKYRLMIEAKKDGNIHVVADVVKDSIDEIAEYLRAETKFILSDFKQ